MITNLLSGYQKSRQFNHLVAVKFASLLLLPSRIS